MWIAIAVYLAFGLMTWIAYPLFNLLLRLNRFGRLVLNPLQRTATNWLGGVLVLALACLVAWAITRDWVVGQAALLCAMMLIPVAGTFNAHSLRKRNILAAYALLLGVVGAGALVLLAAEHRAGARVATLFLIAWVAFSWGANAIPDR